jgi:hypothetical protein
VEWKTDTELCVLTGLAFTMNGAMQSLGDQIEDDVHAQSAAALAPFRGEKGVIDFVDNLFA